MYTDDSPLRLVLPTTLRHNGMTSLAQSASTEHIKRKAAAAPAAMGSWQDGVKDPKDDLKLRVGAIFVLLLVSGDREPGKPIKADYRRLLRLTRATDFSCWEHTSYLIQEIPQ